MTQSPNAGLRGADVVDFDEALLDSCPVQELRELMTEADLVAHAFAPRGQAREIAQLADRLQSGVRELDYGRARARRLAAALKRLARLAA